MSRIKLTLSLLLVSSGLFSQEIIKDKLDTESMRVAKPMALKDRKNGWLVRGTASALFNQAAFSHWVTGGSNSAAITLRGDYEFNFTKNKHLWDNRILVGYGLKANKGDRTQKVEDVMDLTSRYGYEIKKHWYAAGALNFKTQFSKGYDYSLPKDAPYVSNFLSPGYLMIGLGADYIPSDNLQINLHPLTSRMTFVTDRSLKGKFGTKEPNGSFVYALGAYIGGRYRLDLAKNISWDNRLGLFSNYLKKPQNMLVSYQSALDMKINNYLSTQLTLDLLYDENQIKKTQLKQTLGVGLVYRLGDVKN